MAIGTPSRVYGPGIHYGSNVNSFTTGSFTPTASRLLVACLTTQQGDGLMDDSNGHVGITQTHSGSWSWTILGNSSNATFDPNGGTYYGRVFMAYAIVPATPGSGTVTFTFNSGVGALNRNRNIVISNIYQIDGIDTTSPVTQSIIARAGSTSTNTATFGSSLAASSMAFALVGNSYETTDTNIAVPTNYTELHEDPSLDGLFNQQLCVAYDLTSAGTSVNWSSLSALFGSSTIAIEIKEAASGTDHSSTPTDTATISDSAVKTVRKANTDQVTVTDAIVKSPQKYPADTTNISDVSSRRTTKARTDTATVTDSTTRRATKALTDTSSITDGVSFLVSKRPADTSTISDSISTETNYVRTLTDIVTVGDLASPGGVSRSSTQSDTANLVDVYSISVTKAVSDTTTPSDATTKRTTKDTSDTVTSSDTANKRLTKYGYDTVTITDANTSSIKLYKTDTATVIDTTAKRETKTFTDQVTTSDSRIVTFIKTILETLAISDLALKIYTKYITSTATISDVASTSNSGDANPDTVTRVTDTPYPRIMSDGTRRLQEKQ